jgi:hypothetical protein
MEKNESMPEMKTEVEEKICKVLNDKKLINMNHFEDALKQSMFAEEE